MPPLGGFPLSTPANIDVVASQLNLNHSDVEPCGWQKGKLALGLDQRLTDRPPGKYINVTAINPTPLGEGKTVTAIGLAMGLNRIGQRTIVTLREPSQGPLFGIKGEEQAADRLTWFLWKTSIYTSRETSMP